MASDASAWRHKLCPELIVGDAKEAIAWYVKVFDGKCEFEFPDQQNPKKIMHSVVRLVNGYSVYVVDDFPERNDGGSRVLSQEKGKTGNSSISAQFSWDNIDDIWARAMENGAKETLKFEMQFWGDKYGRFVDPFGHEWAVGTVSGEKPPAAEGAENEKGNAENGKVENGHSDEPAVKRHKTEEDA